jgi:PAS domain S-box-containing protein
MAVLRKKGVVGRGQEGEVRQEGEGQFRALVDAAPIPMAVTRLSDGVILYANEQAGRLAGLPPEALVGRRTLEFYDNPADREALMEALRRDGYVRDREVRGRRADGALAWAAVSLQLMTFNGEEAIFVGLHDITDRRRAEGELRRRERQLTEAQKLAHLGSWEWNVRTNRVTWSDELYRIYGLEPQEFEATYEAYLELVYPDDRGLVRGVIEKALGDLKPFSFEERILRPDGTIRALQSQGEVVLGEDGRPLRMVGICQDVTERKRTEEALRESREHSRQIIETANEAFVEIDASGLIMDWNRMAEVTFGWAREEAVGRPMAELIIPPQHREAHQRGLQRFLATGEGPVLNRRVEMTALHREGREFPVELTIWPIRRGETYRFNAFATDITERRQVEEQLRKREMQLLEAQQIAHIGNWEWDIPANVVIWSDELYRIYGLRPGEVQISYEGFLERVHPDDRAHVKGVVEESYRTHKPFSFYHRILWPNGTVRILHGRGRVVVDQDGHPTRMVGTGQDVTEARQTEEALAQQARELKRSNDELEQFAYVASHDLQEPLRKIQAFGDRLRSRWGESLNEEGRDYLERMQEATRRMQALIDDLLTLSRVATQAQTFEPVDLGQVARDAVSDLEVQVEQTGGRVEVGELPTLEADETQMRQLLQNLIHNALKFHREDAPPVVKVYSEALQEGQTEERCQVFVEDNGIGFEEKYADRIFGVFQRLHGRSEYEGTGIGLPICRKIVERHGGSIAVRSEPGKGTTFIVTLPVAQPGGRNGDG